MNKISQITAKTKTYSLKDLIEVIERQKSGIADYCKCDISKVYESITLDGKIILSCRENGKHVIMLCKLSKNYWLESIDTEINEY